MRILVVLALLTASLHAQTPPVAGYAGWWKSDAGVVLDAAGHVSQWQDQSGHGLHFEQSIATRRPTVITPGIGGMASIRFDGVDDGLLGVAAMNFARPSTVFIVYERLNGGVGHIIQNSGPVGWGINGWAFHVNGGIFNSGAVTTRVPDPAQKVVATLTSTTTESRMAVNGEDWSFSPTIVEGSPGRLALGGGEGMRVESVFSQISEIVVYDRVLTASERVQIEDYLAQRYSLYPVTVRTPSISPASQIVSSSTTVTITDDTLGAEIRYTTDGSEPSAASTLYTASFSAPAGTTVKARAFKTGALASSIAQAVYSSAATLPLSSSGLQMWLRADQGLVLNSTSQVERWSDLSGHGNDMVQEVSPKRPSLVSSGIGGQSSLRFDGVDDGLVGVPAMNITRPSTVFVVYQMLAGDNYGSVVQNSAHPSWSIRHDGVFANGGLFNAGFVSRVADALKPSITAVTNDVTSTHAYVNGEDRTEAPQEIAASPGRLALGGVFGAGEDVTTSQIAEVIVYDHALTDAERKLVESYLNARYQIYTAPVAPPTTSAISGTIPFSSTDLKMWLRADQGVTTNSAMQVERWADLSGHGNDITQDGSVQRPTWNSTSMGGQPTVSFDGVDDVMLGVPAMDFQRPSTIIAVVQNLGGNAGHLIQSFHEFPNIRLDTSAYGAPDGVAQTPLPLRKPSTVVLTNGPSSTTMHLNGSDVTTNSAVVNGIPGRLAIGGALGVGFLQYAPAECQIAELMVFEKVLTTTERQTIESYIAARYQIGSSALELPYANVKGGLFNGAATVVLSHSTPEVELRYTTDGSEPTISSTLYSAPLRFLSTTTLRVRAFKTGSTPSAILEERYTIVSPPGASVKWAARDGGNEHSYRVVVWDGTLSAMEAEAAATAMGGYLATVTSEAENQFIINLANNTNGGFWFNTAPWAWVGPFLGGYQPSGSAEPDGNWQWMHGEGAFTFTSWFPGEPNNFDGVDENRILIYGNERQWVDVSDSQNNFTRSFVVEFDGSLPLGQTQPPVVSPASGSYDRSVSVTLSCPTSGAAIRYTTDGSLPDETSTLYSAPVTFTQTTTLRARAFAAGLDPSETIARSYVVRPVPQIVQLTYNGSTLNNGDTLTKSGAIAIELVSATSTQRVDFYRQSGSDPEVLINSDTTPNDGFSASLSLLPISDGDYTLIARAYDSTPTPVETTRSVHVELGVPLRPRLDYPASGLVTDQTTYSIHGFASVDGETALYRGAELIEDAVPLELNGAFWFQVSLEEGDNEFTLVTTNRAGSTLPSLPLHITYVPVIPALSITPTTTTISEGASTTFTVTRNVVSASDLVVTLSSEVPSQLSAPLTVTIPASAASTTFAVQAEQDATPETAFTYAVSASAAGFNGALANVTVDDDDAPTLDLALSVSQVSETAGAGTVLATVSRSPVNQNAVTLQLTNNNPGAATLPSSVTIPAFASTAQVPVTVLDDTSADGTQSVTLQAKLLLDGTNSVLAQSPTRTLTVTDNESAAVTLSFSSAFVREGQSVTATVSRSSATPDPLVVSIAATPNDETTQSSAVTIPANSTSVSFQVSGVNDATADGSQSVVFSATAAGYQSGQSTLIVTDELLPDLIISNLVHATALGTEAEVSYSFDLRNVGLGTSSQPQHIRVALSSDAAPGGDDLITDITFDGTLGVNGTHHQAGLFRAPRASGDYWLVITADANNEVGELVETNNLVISAVPLHLTAAYSATVSTTTTIAPKGTPITLTGSATLSNGQPAATSLVKIHIKLRETDRSIDVLTDTSGFFSTVWNPLPNEAGLYSIGAMHPGENGTPPVQDTFTLVGMSSDPSSATARLVVDAPSQSKSFTIRNLGDTTLSGLNVAVQGAPSGVTATASLINAILPGETVTTLNMSMSATASAPANVALTLHLTSSEGAVLDIPVEVEVAPAVSALAIEPKRVDANVLRGGQKIVSFDLMNVGSAITAPVEVVLPGDLPWMTCANVQPIAALAVGATTQLTLQFTPPPDAALGTVNGVFVIKGAATDLNVPFSLNIVTDQAARVTFYAEDEETYFGASHARLADAKVRLLRGSDNSEIAVGNTNTLGRVDFEGLQPGDYVIEASKAKHHRARKGFTLEAGQDVIQSAILSMQTVSLQWKVTPTLIPDETQIAIVAEFETNVPAPVITVDPPLLDMMKIVSDVQQVDFTFTNHGLITAKNLELKSLSNDDWSIEPLTTAIGDLGAHQSVVVPVIVRNLQASPSSSARSSSSSKSCCGGSSPSSGASLRTSASGGPSGGGGCLQLGVVYGYICGPDMLWHGTEIPVLTATGAAGCGVDSGIFNVSASSSGAGSIFVGAVGSFSAVSCDPEGPPTLQGPNEDPPGSTPDDPGSTPGNPSGDPPFTPKPPRVPQDDPLSDSPPEIIINGPGGPHGGPGNPGNGSGSGIGGGPGDGGNSGTSDFTMLDCAIKLNRTVTNLGGSVTTARPCCFPEDGSGAMELFEQLIGWNNLMHTYIDFFTYFFGDEAWVQSDLDATFFTFMNHFWSAAASSSPNGNLVLGTEMTDLIALAPTGISGAQVEAFLLRWNRTFTNYANGITTAAQAAALGQSIDFMDIVEYLRRGRAMVESFKCAWLVGYQTPCEGAYDVRWKLFEFLTQGGGVCARVKLEIDQSVVQARDVFEATLSLSNEGDDALEDVSLLPEVRDVNGVTVSNAVFYAEVTQSTGLTGSDLPPGDEAKLSITLTPTNTAATQETDYYIGGLLSYTKNGNLIETKLEPVKVTVLPIPQLRLKYFLERDVFSDDPHTTPIEPSIPFSLGVMVENVGHGTAKNLSIKSAQPQIIENEKGLLIDFNIISTQVDHEQKVPGLKADFGDMLPGQRRVGRWLMTSTLHGHFITYKAGIFVGDDATGGRPPLVQSVEMHEMIHEVYADGPFADGLSDFLTNDTPDLLDQPDAIHLSNGTVEPVFTTISASTTAPGGAVMDVPMTANVPGGWVCLRIPEPSEGNMRLVGVTRSDGKELQMGANVWLTDRTFIGFGLQPVREHRLHILDYNSTGSYTLHYGNSISIDAVSPSSAMRTTDSASRQSFDVSWEGTDNTAVAAYDIYVSVDGGPFTRWLTNTRQTSARYRGTPGHTYDFYSVAIDSSGNREAPPSSGDTSTTTSITNAAPVFAAVSNQTLDEGSTLDLQLSATDTDSAGPLTFSLTSAAPAGLVLDPSGHLTWVTGENDGGTVTNVDVIVTDNDDPAATATRSFTITVNEVNRAPVPAMVSTTADEHSTLEIALPAVDGDAPAQTLTWQLISPPSGATVNASTGLLTWTLPSVDATTEFVINYSVTDNASAPLTGNGTLVVTVNQTSAAPEILLSNSTITFTEDSAPLIVGGGGIVLDSDAANFSGGTLRVQISAGSTAEDALWMQLGALENSGTLTLVGSNVFLDDVLVATASNASAVDLAFALSSNATPANVTNLVRHLTFTNSSNTPATTARTLWLQLNDGDGGISVPVMRSLLVQPSNDAPVAGADQHSTITGLPLILSHLLENDSDPEGDALSLTLPSSATTQGGTLSATGNSITYTPPSAFTGIDTFNYSLHANALTTTGPVSIEVKAAAEYVFPATAATRANDGSFSMELKNVPSTTFEVFWSDDLAVWHGLGQATTDAAGTLRFTDGSAVGQTKRFYKFVLP